MSSIKDGTWDSHDQHSTLSKGEWETVRRDMADVPQPTRGTTDYESTVDVSIAARPAWWDRAKCNTGNGQLLALFTGTETDQCQARDRYCLRCPVQTECLIDSFAESYCGVGMRGGVKQRARVRARTLYRAGTPIEDILWPTSHTSEAA
jgi:hypothetical protein